jgi:hypothetical protein
LSRATANCKIPAINYQGAVMHILSLIHIGAGLISLLVAGVIFCLPKGSPRHRLFGWIYAVSLGVSLLGILVRAAAAMHPFTVYAFMISGVMVAGITAVRARKHVSAWRSWHAGLMCMTVLASVMATLAVLGSGLIGDTGGPAFYRTFNVVIIGATVVGLMIINFRPVIWGRPVAAHTRTARLQFNGLVIATSALLVIGQLPMS